MKKYTVIAESGIIIAGKRHAKGATVELASGAILEAALRFKQVEPAKEEPAEKGEKKKA